MNNVCTQDLHSGQDEIMLPAAGPVSRSDAEKPAIRTLAFMAFAFSGGVCLAQYGLPASQWLPAALLCAVLGVVLSIGKTFRKRVLLIAAGMTLAMLWCRICYVRVQAPAEALAGTEHSTTMTLLDYPSPTSYGAKAVVRMDGKYKTLYYGKTELMDLQPGDTVTDTVRLKNAAHLREEDTSVYTSQGIFLLAYAGDEPDCQSQNDSSPRWLPVRCGHALKEQIHTLFDGDTAGFLIAILTGDKSALSENTRSDLTEAGIYHLTAVSGMHCAVLLSLLTLLTGRHRRRLTAAIAIPALLFYALLTGCSPSVVRACVMLIAVLLAPLFRRTCDPPTAMSAALMLILLQNPCAVQSLSLQLSFGAVAGLLWIAPGIRRRLPGKRFRYLSDSLSATLGITVLTTPISAYAFGTFQLIAPAGNLLCLWAASLIFGTGLLAALLPFPALAGLFAIIPRLLVRYTLWAAGWLSRIPGHALSFTNPYLIVWLVFVYLLFALAVLMKASRRIYALAAVLASAVLLVSVRLGQLRFSGHPMDAVVLDVGQGQCILLKSGRHAAMVDCGSANSWIHPGNLASVQLRDMGLRHLDCLLLTHYDTDHVSGVPAFLHRTKVDRLLLPDTASDASDETLQTVIVSAAAEAGTAIEYVTSKTVYPLGSAALTVYPPLNAADGGSNDAGLSVLASAGGYDLLITGDMSGKLEQLLLETYSFPDIETLIAGHHGSKNATSWELLQTLCPETVCISVGSNSYGHPAQETLRRLSQTDVYRTDLHGNIHLYVNERRRYGS